MKRGLLLAAIALLSLAQNSRDGYREAYRIWRETDPNLEREAAAGGDAIGQRADRMAAEAAKYAAARKSFLDGLTQDQAEQVSWLENAVPPAESNAASTKADAQFIAAETALVTRNIETFANDPDRGIQQLRQALARERTALEGLGALIAQRKKAADTLDAAAGAIGPGRAKALEPSRDMLEGLKAASADTVAEGAAWAEYYRKVGEGAQGAATPITEGQPGAPPAVLNNPIPAPPTVTALPLARYVGAWTYPAENGMYHGTQPESFDVVVKEENGLATGTAFARFKLPPGSTGDPTLRFDFKGEFQTTRRQVFNLLTAEGTIGTIELIPGPAFNLLEVNFQTEAKAGKVRQADVVLVKK